MAIAKHDLLDKLRQEYHVCFVPKAFYVKGSLIHIGLDHDEGEVEVSTYLACSGPSWKRTGLKSGYLVVLYEIKIRCSNQLSRAV